VWRERLFVWMFGQSNVLRASRADPLLDDPAAETNHRIANSLSIVASLIHAQSENLPAEGTLPVTDFRDWLQELAAKIEAIGELHRLLVSSQQSGVVDLGIYLHTVVDSAIRSFTSGKRTEISFDFKPNCTIPAKHGAAIGLLISEAITNALKYSHPTEPMRKIRISLASNASLHIEVSDNGTGFPAGLDPYTARSTGLRLMRGIADQLGGRLEFDQNPNGLAVRLELPNYAPPEKLTTLAA
jgi:two-component system, sensor histidine kinase PdtaS